VLDIGAGAGNTAVDTTVARLDYAEDLYRDWNDGGRSQGGASARIDAEFARIRRELGDLPGVVSSPTWLRRMLAKAGKEQRRRHAQEVRDLKAAAAVYANQVQVQVLALRNAELEADTATTVSRNPSNLRRARQRLWSIR
jgi:hypothetical protein